MWLCFITDTLVKLKNLKLLDLRHNKMKEVFVQCSLFWFFQTILHDSIYNSNHDYPASSWFLLCQTREKPLWACASLSHPTWYIWCQFHLSNYFLLEVFVQKNANFSPKALTKEQSIPLLKYCIYLVCGVHIKPKVRFSCLLSCGFPGLIEHNTPGPPPNNNSRQYNP